jgi:hypothetical protein
LNSDCLFKICEIEGGNSIQEIEKPKIYQYIPKLDVATIHSQKSANGCVGTRSAT